MEGDRRVFFHEVWTGYYEEADAVISVIVLCHILLYVFFKRDIYLPILL